MSSTRFLACAVAMWIVVVTVIASGGPLLTNDGPAHFFGAFVHANIDQPALGFADHYLLHLPPSSRGFVDLFLPLYELLDKEQSTYTLTVVVCVTIWMIGALFAAVQIHGTASASQLVIVCFAFQTAYFFGLFPFILGTGFAFLGLGLWMRCSARPWFGTFLAGSCFFLAARCHVVAAAAVGLLLAADAISRGRRIALIGALAGLPVCWVVFELRQRVASSAAEIFYTPLLERLQHFPDGFIPGPFWKTWPALVLVIAGFVLGRRTPRRALALVAAGLLAVSIVLPRDFMGWQFAGWRFIPIAAVVGLALLPVPATWWGRVVVASIGALQLGWSAWFHHDQRRESAPLLAAIETIEPKPRFRFPIVRHQADNSVYFMSPNIHLGQLVTARTGGAIFFGHDTSLAYHFILLKDGPVIPEAAKMSVGLLPGLPGDAMMSRLMTRAARFDGVVYYGFPEEAAYLRTLGYEITFASGRLIVADLVGCPLTLQVEGATEPVTVAVGLGGVNEPVSQFTVNPGGVPDHSHTIERFPCGARWMTVSGAHQRCTRVEGEVAVLRCTLPAAASTQTP